jgi:uncharacterized lipoprotein YmbA
MLLLTACASPPIEFYMLDATGEADKPGFDSRLPQGLIIGVGPVHLPEYLNRPQLVIETAENQYRLDERHRWAERLDENVARSLFQQLSAGLVGVQMLRYPWSYRQIIDYQISVDILAFHQAADGFSHLQAQWRIRQQEQNVLVRSFNCKLPADVDNPSDIVKVQSVCLFRLGVEIEAGLAELQHITAGKDTGVNLSRDAQPADNGSVKK